MHNKTLILIPQKYAEMDCFKLYFTMDQALCKALNDLNFVTYSTSFNCYMINNIGINLIQLKAEVEKLNYKCILEKDSETNIKKFTSTNMRNSELMKNTENYSEKGFTIAEIENSKVIAEEKNHHRNFTKNIKTDEKKNNQVISVRVVNKKGFLKLPIPFLKEWVVYLKNHGYFFEYKNKVWIINNFKTEEKHLDWYFKTQNCTLKINIEKVSRAPEPKKEKYIKKDNNYINEFVKMLILENLRPSTISNYECQLYKITSYYSIRNPAEITEEQIRDYLFYIREDLKKSASSQNLIINAIKKYYDVILISTLNTGSIPRPKRIKSLPKIISREEVLKLLQVETNIKNKCIIHLLYSTGMRRGELLQMRVNDIDFNKSIITIHDGKGGEGRIVVMAEKIKGLLQKYIQEHKPTDYFLVGQKGGMYSGSSIEKIVNKLKFRAGVTSKLTPHIFRHSYATHLHDSGVDIRNIQVLLGHKSTKTTEIYTHVSKKDICEIKSPLDSLDL